MGGVIVPKLITAPTSPVTLDEAKQHLRVDTMSSPGPDDDLIASIIDAAVAYVDGPSGVLRQSVLPTTWEVAYDAFPEAEIELPLPYVQSVSSVKYTDTAGVEQTVSSSDYEVDTYGSNGWVVPVEGFSWPATMETINAVKVRWVSGLDECPSEVRAAILLMIGHLYDNRGSVPADVPPAVDALLHRRKRLVFA